MISRDDLPPTPDWRCEPRACPFPTCAACEAAQQKIPENVTLSDN